MNISTAVMKVILLTGATDGIGLETAKQLTSQGHKVLLHGRNPSKLQKVAHELGVPTAQTFVADLSDPSQVFTMAKDVQEKHPTIHVLINNAGIFKTSPTTTSIRLDVRMAVNTLAPYILTKQLLVSNIPKHGRVVNVSSAAQSPLNPSQAFSTTAPKIMNDNQAYAQSKLALIMWSNALAAKHPDHIIVSVNPASFLGSKMVHQAYGVSGKDLSIGADILVKAATGQEFAHSSGNYFDNDRGVFSYPHPDAMDAAKNQQVVDAMEQLLVQLGLA